MATAPTVSTPETTTVTPTQNGPIKQGSFHAVSARNLLRMGKAATVGAGLNWLTVVTILVFHVGALAALFLFSWQRLVVMAILYVLAINVGIGMCYHRLLTHRGYHVP